MTLYKQTLKGKLKSKYWWTKFYHRGQLVRQSTKCTSKKKAAEFEIALRSQLNFGRIGIEHLNRPKESPKTFAELLTDYVDTVEIKESTRRRYSSASKPLIEYFAKTPMDKFKAEDVEKYRAWRKKQKKKAPARLLAKNPRAKQDKQIKPATVNRELTLLSGFFKSLVRSGRAKENPVTGVTFLREDNEQTRVVAEQELNAYLMACSQPLLDVALLMYEMGMRPGEIFNLRKEDVDFENERLMIRTGKTKAAKRRLTMSYQAREILLRRYKRSKNELLFPGGKKGDRDTPIKKLTNAHYAAITRCKVKSFRLYDLRHTFATHATEAGVDLMTLKAILGHSRLEMVQRYSHPTEQHQADAILKIQMRREKTKGERKLINFPIA